MFWCKDNKKYRLFLSYGSAPNSFHFGQMSISAGGVLKSRWGLRWEKLFFYFGVFNEKGFTEHHCD